MGQASDLPRDRPGYPFWRRGNTKLVRGGRRHQDGMQHQPRKELKVGGRLPTTTETPDKDAAPWEHFCAIKRTVRKRSNRTLRLHPSCVHRACFGKSGMGRRRHSAIETILRKTGEDRRLRHRIDGSVCQSPPNAREAACTGHTGRPLRLGVGRRTGSGERSSMVAPQHTHSMQSHQCHKYAENVAKGDRRG